MLIALNAKCQRVLVFALSLVININKCKDYIDAVTKTLQGHLQDSSHMSA